MELNTRAAVWQRMQEIASQDKVSNEEFAEYRALEVKLDTVDRGTKLAELPEGILDDTLPMFASPGERAATLKPEQRFATWAAANVDQPDETRGLSFGKLLKGAALGKWDGADGERRALQESVGASGGFLVPTDLSANLIDLARAKATAMNQATVVPMTTSTVKVPKIATDPAVAWRDEGSAFAESDLTIGANTLEANGLGVLTKVSIELLSDSVVSMEGVLQNIFAQAIALEWDRVTFYGDGDASEPVGLINTTGVTQTALTGAPADWDFVVDLYGNVEDANYDVSAGITSPRVGRQFGKLKTGIASDNTPLTPPGRISGIPLLESTQINVDDGGGSNESQIFAGDWSQVYWGVHTDLEIIVLRERYMADEGTVGFLAWSRGDLAFPRTSAFAIATEITA